MMFGITAVLGSWCVLFSSPLATLMFALFTGAEVRWGRATGRDTLVSRVRACSLLSHLHHYELWFPFPDAPTLSQLVAAYVVSLP
jgi:hypothetical protein